jgi:hypothetical protein
MIILAMITRDAYKKIDQTTGIYITTKRRRDETMKSRERTPTTGNVEHTTKELVHRKQRLYTGRDVPGNTLLGRCRNKEKSREKLGGENSRRGRGRW